MSKTITVPYVPGDGSGPYLVKSAIQVADVFMLKHHFGVAADWMEVPAGESAFTETGDYLPRVTTDAIRKHKVCIKGPLRTPTGGGIQSLNVQLRQRFGLYANIRPISYMPMVSSPVLHPDHVNMVVFRENTEDVYAGLEYFAGSRGAHQLIDFVGTDYPHHSFLDPNNTGFDLKFQSKAGAERIFVAALTHAIKFKRYRITVVHKGNIMKATEGAFLNWIYDYIENSKECRALCVTGRELQKIWDESGWDAMKQHETTSIARGKIIVDSKIADAFLQDSLIYPERFEIIVTMNLNGDYISDALAGQVGGIGIAPGGNVNFETGYYIAEAVHGTADEHEKTGTANPTALILSTALLLDFLGFDNAITIISGAVRAVIGSGHMTGDLARGRAECTTVNCAEFTEMVCDYIRTGSVSKFAKRIAFEM